MRIPAFLIVMMLACSPAFAEKDKVIEKIERTSPNHTTIIYKDYRAKPAAKKPEAPRPATVEFKEYDLGPAPAPQPQAMYHQSQPAARTVPQAPVQTYSQDYSPGPNRGKAANGGSLAPGGAIFSNGFYPYGLYPYYPYAGYYPYPGRRHHHRGHVPGPGRVVGAPSGFQNLPAQRFAPPPPATSPYAYPGPVVRGHFPRCHR